MDHLDDMREGVDDLGKKEFMSVRRTVALSLPFLSPTSQLALASPLLVPLFLTSNARARTHTHLLWRLRP